MFKNSIYTLFLVFVFISCEKNKHVRTYRLPKEGLKSVQPEVQENSEFSISWEKPENWAEVKGHSMRLASFNVPYSQGVGDLSITTFGGSSGGIGPNVNRWLGQIGLEAMSNSDIESISIQKVGLLSEYLYFKLINDADETTAILASIFQLKNKTVFVKLSSTLIGSKEIESDFILFCNSIRQGD